MLVHFVQHERLQQPLCMRRGGGIGVWIGGLHGGGHKPTLDVGANVAPVRQQLHTYNAEHADRLQSTIILTVKNDEYRHQTCSRPLSFQTMEMFL